MTQRLVTLMSGGIESLVVAALAKKTGSTCHAFFVDYGQVPVERERQASRAIARRYGMNLEEVTLGLPYLEGYGLTTPGIMYSDDLAEELGVPHVGRREVHRSHVIPMRNLFILGLAASYAESVGAGEIWTGFDYRPNLPTATVDKSPEFVNALNFLMGVLHGPDEQQIRILAPLQGNSKGDTIVEGERLHVEWRMSWSCYNDLDYACGVCAQCLTRRETFKALNVYDPTEYHSLEFIREQLGK